MTHWDDLRKTWHAIPTSQQIDEISSSRTENSKRFPQTYFSLFTLHSASLSLSLFLFYLRKNHQIDLRRPHQLSPFIDYVLPLGLLGRDNGKEHVLLLLPPPPLFKTCSTEFSRCVWNQVFYSQWPANLKCSIYSHLKHSKVLSFTCSVTSALLHSISFSMFFSFSLQVTRDTMLPIPATQRKKKKKKILNSSYSHNSATAIKLFLFVSESTK